MCSIRSSRAGGAHGVIEGLVGHQDVHVEPGMALLAFDPQRLIFYQIPVDFCVEHIYLDAAQSVGDDEVAVFPVKC